MIRIQPTRCSAARAQSANRNQTYTASPATSLRRKRAAGLLCPHASRTSSRLHQRRRGALRTPRGLSTGASAAQGTEELTPLRFTAPAARSRPLDSVVDHPGGRGDWRKAPHCWEDVRPRPGSPRGSRVDEQERTAPQLQGDVRHGVKGRGSEALTAQP